MGTPEGIYKYYYYYKDSTYGVVSSGKTKVVVENLESGKQKKVSKGWIMKKIGNGEVDISKKKEGFD